MRRTSTDMEGLFIARITAVDEAFQQICFPSKSNQSGGWPHVHISAHTRPMSSIASVNIPGTF